MGGKRQAHHVQTRIRLVRRLVVEGMAEGEIVQVLTRGVRGPDGQPIKVSEATARRDLAAVASEFRDLFDSDDAIEREIGAAFDRYRQIAIVAAKGPKPNFPAAISANDRIVKIAASRSTRWAHLAGVAAVRALGEDSAGLPPLVEGDSELMARAQELATMDMDELRDHHRQLRDRVAALGLDVVEGGKASSSGA